MSIEHVSEKTPVLAVTEGEGPVICNPYEEPDAHFTYPEEAEGRPYKYPGRRSAGYYYRIKKVSATDASLFGAEAEERRDPLDLVNLLREDVKRWRKADYRGASIVTRDLLRHWSSERMKRRLFFCQREAVETLVYLLELRLAGRSGRTGFQKFAVSDEDLQRLLRNEKPSFVPDGREWYPTLVDPSSDSSLLALQRLGCKMATGTGKTVIMAMTIAWAFCNRARNPGTKEYPNAVLVCAPNLTVRKRLQVLKPDHEHNFYDDFGIVPLKYRELLNFGKVHVTNWHIFAAKSPHKEGDKAYRVVDKGEETNDAFAADRLGDLFDSLPILVLNDEGHHCWRPKPDEEKLTKEEKKELEDEEREARIWLDGLDRINNAGVLGEDEDGRPRPCILSCIDLSATPFYIKGSGHAEGTPFPWLISDFGLVDAIESGLVKVPRLPVLDDTGKTDDVGRPDPKYFRLWKHITEKLKPGDRLSNKRPKPDIVFMRAEDALQTLAGQWNQRFEQIRHANPLQENIPPVMIVVCDNTEISRVFFQEISGEREETVPKQDGKGEEKITVFDPDAALLPELANTEALRHTIQIDSKTLAELNAGEGASKDEAIERLREVVDTVGQRGQPGEHVRCVVSVSMLTEGWSANNVTHILGVRAFGSQLLCEQVVGRGLRRMNYTPDPANGLLPAEFVDVYGIPFSIIPFKGRATDSEAPEDKPKNHVYAMPDRVHLEMRFPLVEGYVYALRQDGITCDVDELEELIVGYEPNEVFLEMTRGYKDDPHAHAPEDLILHTREEFYSHVHFQQVLFNITRLIVDDLVHGAEAEGTERAKVRLIAKHMLFPEVFRIAQRYAQRRVRFKDGVDKRELGLKKNCILMKQRIRDGVLPKAASDEVPLLPVINSYRPYLSTKDVDYVTVKPVHPTTRSHLNAVRCDSSWERDATKVLEAAEHLVEHYAPNDNRVGLTIPYDYLNEKRYYEPDFMVKIVDGPTVLVEIKGWAGERDEIKQDEVNAKNAATKKWIAAVNNYRKYGAWEFLICREVEQLEKQLAQFAPADRAIPFSTLEPKEGELFNTCVPLLTLRAAAGHFGSSQEVEIDRWVRPHTSRTLRDGMFVARVHGHSMEPRIPDGAWCLFQAGVTGTRQDRIVLVQHREIADPDNGGQYTVKKYRSTKNAHEDGSWSHDTIELLPLNPEFDPITITADSADDLLVIAEFLEVLG